MVVCEVWMQEGQRHAEVAGEVGLLISTFESLRKDC